MRLLLPNAAPPLQGATVFRGEIGPMHSCPTLYPTASR